jgi:voltage-gated potassium channel Kch
MGRYWSRMNDTDGPDQNAFSAWRRFQLPALAALALIATVMGMAGFAQYEHSIGKAVHLTDSLYLSLQLFTLNSGAVEGPVPWLLQISRFLAPFITFIAVAEALIGIFRGELRALRLSRNKGHVVICGVGRKAAALVRDCRREHNRIVVIDPDPESRLRRACEGAGAFVLQDDASRPGCLLAARAHHAEHVFITTGDDSTNIEIASHFINLVRAQGDALALPNVRPTCHVHLVDRQTAELFQKHRVFKEAARNVDIHIFNVFDNAARLLWREHLLTRGPIAPADTRRMHVVIGGMGQMGEAVLLRIARSGHYANGRKVALTLVDREAERCKARLLAQYPSLGQVCDLDFIEAELGQPETARRIASALSAPDQIGTVLLCLDQDYANFAIALRMMPHLGPDGARIFARLSHAAGLCELLGAEHADSALARQIDGFGLVEDCCAKEMVLAGNLNRFARSFHESYVREQLKAGIAGADPSLQPWNTLHEDFRESNCEQAEHMEVKLRTFGYSALPSEARLPQTFDDAQVDALGRMEHARWRAERQLAGWGYASGPKNIDRRTSPHLVPWSQLDPSIKKIAFDFIRALPRILSDQQSSRG